MKCDVSGCSSIAVFKNVDGACYCYSCAGAWCHGTAWMLEPIAKPDMFAVAARHVAYAYRDERSLDRLLDRGRFGATSAGDPWPEHDAALARDMVRGAQRSWLFAVQALLAALLEEP